jgi:hypothetical protein
MTSWHPDDKENTCTTVTWHPDDKENTCTTVAMDSWMGTDYGIYPWVDGKFDGNTFLGRLWMVFLWGGGGGEEETPGHVQPDGKILKRSTKWQWVRVQRNLGFSVEKRTNCSANNSDGIHSYFLLLWLLGETYHYVARNEYYKVCHVCSHQDQPTETITPSFPSASFQHFRTQVRRKVHIFVYSNSTLHISTEKVMQCGRSVVTVLVYQVLILDIILTLTRIPYVPRMPTSFFFFAKKKSRDRHQ